MAAAAACLAVASTGCFSVKVDTSDTFTTDISLSDILTDTLTDTLPTTVTEPTTDPTVGPTTIDPTTIDPTTIDPTTIDPVTTDPTTIDPVTTFPTTIEPSSTTPLAFCGDGVTEAPEQCDDGNDVETDACLSDCVLATCGDGFVFQGTEVCDDGLNDNSYEGCAPGCQALGPHCGDGVMQGDEGELCDDANEIPGDGCNNCIVDGLPDDCASAVALTEPSRNVAFQSDDVECDLDLPEDGQWSRYAGSAGSRMPTTAPPLFACGTHAPGWLSGQEPTLADGVVERDVCFHWQFDTCHFKTTISVRNCGPFLMYRLPATPSCALRYCGEG